jgi:hypothetical protein
MQASPFMVTLVLTLMWFATYWLIGGVGFAIVGYAQFMRINMLRFSCLFTFISVATAYAAAWGSLSGVNQQSPRCLDDVVYAYQVIPEIFQCAPRLAIGNGVMWFVILLAMGVLSLLISRLPERSRS